MRKIGRNIQPIVCNILVATAAILLFTPPWVHASGDEEDEEYITISVDAVDSSGNVTYALDTDDPAAFTESNEFAIPAGTTHTIYVKDEAGNITSQEYPGQTEVPPDNLYFPGSEPESQIPEAGDLQIDIELDRTPSVTMENKEPVEPGAGTVYDKTRSDSSTDAEKVFYTVTTNEGEVFYLVIDQGQTSNNVYLLDQVKLSDLKALSVDDTASIQEEEKSSSLLDALSNTDSSEKELLSEDGSNAQTAAKNNGSTFIILILAAGGGVIYYYMKVYKNKKDTQMDLTDAMEREDFEADYPEDDELDFELEEGYQEEALNRLFEEEDEYGGPGTDESEMFENLKEEELIPGEDFIPEPDDFEFEFEEDGEEELL